MSLSAVFELWQSKPWTVEIWSE